MLIKNMKKYCKTFEKKIEEIWKCKATNKKLLFEKKNNAKKKFECFKNK